MSEAVRERCDARFLLRPMPAVEVKGLPGPLAIFALEGIDAVAEPSRPGPLLP